MGDFIRYHGGIAKMKSLIDSREANKFRDVKTTVLVGKAGEGKTRMVVDKHGYENVFVVENGQDDKFLFDGYDGEDVICIDDFNGTIKYTTLLRILDGHKLGLNIKNGRTYAKWTQIYITSNNKPALWYRTTGENLKRRITDCLEVSKGNTRALLEPWDAGVHSDTDENIVMSISEYSDGDM